MRTRAFLYACVAFAAALPVTASAGAVVTAAVTTPPGAISAGATVQVTCSAEGRPTSGMLGSTTTTIAAVDVTVTGGTVNPSHLTGAVSGPCSYDATKTCSELTATVSWASSMTPGTYSATCTASYTTTQMFGSSTGSVSNTAPAITTVQGALPPVVSPVAGPDQMLVGTSSTFQVTASDPNTPPQPLTYAWTATGGTVTPGATVPSTASFTAPAQAGAYDVMVTVAAGTLSSQAKKTVNVVLAQYQAGLSVPLGAPRRIAASQDGLGGIYVIDGRQDAVGRVELLTVKGEVRGTVTLPEPALAVAQGGGSLWVTTIPGNVYRVDSATGKVAGPLSLERPLLKPFGIAWDSTSSTLWIAESGAGRVRVIRPDGTTVAMLSAAGTVALGTPVDVGVDAGHGRAWVLDADSNAAGYHLHAFGLDGTYVASFLTDSELGRGGGLAVGPDGRVYVSDSYQGVVVVRDVNGAPLGTIGAFGDAAGQLVAPAGLAVLTNGDVAVTTPTNEAIERYGNGTALPTTCMVRGQLDSDCDGLPDWWELAHGLNPFFAGDALLAYGRAGMSNYELYAYETQYGTDPWATPTASVTVPSQAKPGVVKLVAALSAPPLVDVGCMWRQVSGPAVTLSGASGSTPSFIARASGDYGFEVIPATSFATGTPVRAVVTVANVAPVANPGRIVVAGPGGTVRLDGTFSSDANGDALTYEWDQTLGPAVTGTVPGATLAAPVRRPGLYRFMLTATDAKGATSSAEVPVLVTAPPISTAVAVTRPAAPQAGDSVTLDGTGSLFADASPSFTWEQVEGPAAPLAGAHRPVAAFVPATAGRYRYALTITGSDGQVSPPTYVDVYVAEAGKALPAIQSASTPAAVVAVNTAVSLEASGTGSGYLWKQVAGPAAGLTDEDRGTATVVPFSPGFYAFEVSATDGEALSPPARVTFEARAGDAPIPVARISVPGLAPVARQLVFLDGRGSTGATHYRWTQVGGPWVVLGSQAAVTSFRPHDPGTYAFELEVDDGSVRSAPARVEVVVMDGGVQ